MSKSIGVFGAGSGLGQAVAHRYAREGYDVALVARRREPLELLAKDLAPHGVAVHVVTADLADTDAIGDLAERIRAGVGGLDAFYYGPNSADPGFTPAADLTPRQARGFMSITLYTLVALVQQFLPHMLHQGDGAVLTAPGASALQGMPGMSGPGPALAAQRNYLQALHAEVAGKGVYVGELYIGALIADSAVHAGIQAAREAGAPVPDWAATPASPHELADLLWNMHTAKDRSETVYPADLFDR
ncbi:SDR family NAD(P)-dependent oxidoreductase [Streptosporangium sp. NPDC000396]|uniref:SDR family NAD(P)-dependent oxidoreductase n=1 Tax=Streptosporangium sp. NPDC000396 TaxID=3366185 RepID=UPI00369295E1